jgi:hypothetical protein
MLMLMLIISTLLVSSRAKLPTPMLMLLPITSGADGNSLSWAIHSTYGSVDMRMYLRGLDMEYVGQSITAYGTQVRHKRQKWYIESR